MKVPQSTIIDTYGDYGFRRIEWSDLAPFYEENRAKIFAGGLTFFPDAVMADVEREALNQLSKASQNNFRLNVGIYHGDDLVGWSFGWQQDAFRYYMTNTGILPEHQDKGVYSALLPRILETLTAVGFQIICSRHVATNNQVIVPKLKAGFVITGMELTDMFGLLVHLTWYTNPKRRKVLEFRSGALKPDDEMKALLNL